MSSRTKTSWLAAQRGGLLALASAVLFGASAPASKLLLGQLGALQLAGLLYLGAAVGMVVPALRNRAGFVRLDRKNFLRLSGAVVLGGIAGPVLLLYGLELGNAGSVSLLLNLELAATAVVGALLFREHVGRSAWLGTAGMVAAGMAVTTADGWPGLASAALVAGACLCWALDNHFTALIDGTTAVHTTFLKGLIAGTATLALGLLLEPWRATATGISAALAVGALAYGASIALYIISAQEIGATRAQGVFATAPFLGAGLSFLFLGDAIGLGHVLAICLLAPSVALILRSQHTHEHEHRALEHTHSHRHDDGHHNHVHPGLPASTRHTHLHSHEPMRHSHPHWPDLHHRHGHGKPR